MAQTPPATLHTPPVQDASGRTLQPSSEDPPEKNPEQYSANVVKRGQGLQTFVTAFFTENIGRARDRNAR